MGSLSYNFNTIYELQYLRNWNSWALFTCMHNFGTIRLNTLVATGSVHSDLCGESFLVAFEHRHINSGCPFNPLSVRQRGDSQTHVCVSLRGSSLGAGSVLNVWFIFLVFTRGHRNSNQRIINPPEFLHSWSIRAAKNWYFYKFSLRKGSLFCDSTLNF